MAELGFDLRPLDLRRSAQNIILLLISENCLQVNGTIGRGKKFTQKYTN